MRDRHQGDELGQFAATLLVDIKADRDTLQQWLIALARLQHPKGIDSLVQREGKPAEIET